MSSADILASEAAPELALLESSHIKPSDHTKVTRAAFQRSEQVPIGLCVGFDY